MQSFIVTSDWHIGAPMNSAGKAAEDFREAKYKVATRIGEIAQTDAKALFILGDLFDSDRVGETDILRIAEKLSKMPCPVYVMPGNHDWWHHGGTMHTFSRFVKKHDNIHILLEDSPFTVEGLSNMTFFPSPLRRKNPIKDTSEWIPERNTEHGLRIALLHGSIDTAPGGNIPTDVAKVRDLDLVFLGDWHNPLNVNNNTYYCGSPEPGGFDEGHEGQVLVVEIDGNRLKVKPVIIGRLCWQRIELEFVPKGLGGLGCQSLIQSLGTIASPPETTTIRLHLSGTLSWDELNELDQFLGELQVQGWAHIDTENVQVEPAGEVNINTFPDAIQAVAQEILDSAATEIVKRRALAILNAKWEEIQ